MHAGHILTLQFAKSLGDWLVVNVLSDERMRLKKGPHRPLIPAWQRRMVLEQFPFVDKAICIPGEEYPIFAALERCKPDILVLNVTENSDITAERRYCDERGIRIVEIERIEVGVSTTALTRKLRSCAEVIVPAINDGNNH